MPDIFDHPAAFSPFYDELVTVSGRRRDGKRNFGQFAACIIDGGFDDVIDDEVSASSRRRTITVHIPKSGTNAWREEYDRPQIGDSITLQPGLVFAVTAVNIHDRSAYILEAREK